MQFRRRALWIALLFGSAIVAGVGFSGIPSAPLEGLSETSRAAEAIRGQSGILPIVFGIMLADRVRRDRKLGVEELFNALPVSVRARLWGKYLGATTATITPMLVGYLMVVASKAFRQGDPGLVVAFVPVFLLVVLPGLLFIGAFSIAATELLPTTLYAILFIGYWPWGNLFPPRPIPNLSCTPLTAIGRYASIGFFGQDPDPGGTCRLTQQDIGIAAGIGSVVLLLLVAALAITAAQGLQQWRLSRR